MSEDRRILRTRKLLGEALIAEAREKGYKNITIQDVTKRADVGYRTYFRHYTGLDELLVSVAQDRLDDFYQLLDLPLPGELIADPVEFFHKIGHTIFQHIEQNQDMFRFLLLDDSLRFVLDPVKSRACQKAEVLLSGLPQENISAGVAANHIISSVFSLMRWWLENDLRHSPQKMGDIFTNLIIKPTWLVMTQEEAQDG
ncbi:MAG: TetR/AcrR family transcriptional regulator [Anaerolineales bacterium]